jgi:glycosyltransferase involved in cell wall biosynthesis
MTRPLQAALPVSVVIPARNRAWTLPACLESVLRQTRPAAEVLVVDDGSTDNTAEVLAGFADRGVRLVRQNAARGAQAARNLGWQQASQAWIAFHDSDDLWLPEKLERQWDGLQRAALLGASLEDHVAHGNGLQRNPDGSDHPMRLPVIEGRCLDRLLAGPGPVFPALLVSRALLVRAGGLDEDCTAYQEWDTAIRLAAAGGIFVHLPEALFVWVRHEGETISRDGDRALLAYVRILHQHRNAIVATHGERHWRQALLGRVAVALQSGRFEVALRLLEGVPAHRSVHLARWLAVRRVGMRGLGRLLHRLA